MGTKIGKTNHWCHKVLPTVFDESLSYYELLCKVSEIANQLIENCNRLGIDVSNLCNAYNQLQEYVNSYFGDIDVQDEINNKLDTMSADGTLGSLIQPLFDSYKEATDNAIAVYKANTDNMVNNNKESTDIAIASLNARMNTFTSLVAGSTTGDAELVDARVDVNGKIWGNVGEHIRSVNNTIKSVQSRSINTDLLINALWEQGSFESIIDYLEPNVNSIGTRIRTEFRTSSGNLTVTRLTDEYEYVYAIFDTDGNDLAGNAGWVDNDMVFNVSNEPCIVRFAIRKVDNSPITVNDLHKCGIFVCYNGEFASFKQVSVGISDNTSLIGSADINHQIRNYLPTNPNHWEQGGLSSYNDFAGTTTNTRIRVIKFPFTLNKFKVNLSNTGYKLIAYFYDKDMNYLGNLFGHKNSDVKWLNEDTIVTLPKSVRYVNYALARNDDSAITPTDALGVTVIVEPFDTKPETLRVMSYNMGLYNYGVSPYALTTENYDEKLAHYKKFFAKEKCDVLGLQECGLYLDENKEYLSNDELFSPLYRYKQDVDSWTCIKSKYPIFNSGVGSFVSSNRKYSYGEINVGDKSVFLLCVHLSANADNVTIREQEYAELNALLSDKERFIVFGDFNPANVSEFDNLSVNVNRANGGYLGWYWTYSYTGEDFNNYTAPSANIRYFDNILVSSNIVIENTEVPNVYNELSSDHIPVIADLLVY